MDSANSGSLQSSSGGDEEYDSRAADSISTFMTVPNPPPFFDPLSNYLHTSLLNPAPAWPITRPDPTHSTMMNPTLPTSSPFMPPNTSTVAPPPQNQNPAAARASKKRSRASRRAPTTVLTTDTTNFRAMVQEFTGIPAPPFNNSSFPRNRLDLFSAAPPPPYLRRPFPQKAHSTTAASSSYQLQLPISQSSNLFNNIPNPLLTSFLQSNPNPKFPLFPNTAPKMGGLDEQFAGLQNLIHGDDTNINASMWNDNPVRDGDRKDDGAYNFHSGKAPENVGGRGEGMVESWICSSE